MAPLNAHVHRTGWSRAAIACTAALVVLLWASGVLLQAWPADAAFDLGPTQLAWRRTALVAHGAGAWVFCLFAGRWIWPHATLVWRRRVNWIWLGGVAMALVLLLVALTGLVMLYGAADVHPAAAAVHWWVALGSPALLLAHAVVRRSQRAAARRRPG